MPSALSCPLGPRVVILLSVSLAAALRLIFLSMGLEVIDRQFVPDDTYYTLAIARNIAAGLGPSVDGVALTTGFQPLIALLVAPAFLFLDDPEQVAMVAVGFSTAFGLLSVALMVRLTLDLTGSERAALAVGVLAATTPILLISHLNGLETALATATLLGALVLVAQSRPDSGRRHFLLTGLCVGLAVLARIDAVVALAPIALWGLARFGWRPVLTVTAAALVVVAPWVGFCLVVGGSPIPESGAAVRHIAEVSGHSTGMAVIAGVLALGAVVPGAMLDLSLLASGLVVFVFLVWIGTAFGKRHFSFQSAMALSGVGLFLAYTTWLGAIWFFDRYFTPIYAMALILGVSFAVSLPASARARVVLTGVVAMLVAANLWSLNPYVLRPGETVFRPFSPPMEYRAVALDLLVDLPPGTRLGAMQSGALNYFAPAHVRVVNLDGVVNGPAARATRDGTLCHYIASEGLTHFADWQLNRAQVLLNLGAGDAVQFDHIRDSVVSQGAHRFALYHLGPECASQAP